MSRMLLAAALLALSATAAADLTCARPSDGGNIVDLVGYWPMDTTSQAEDASGSGYHLSKYKLTAGPDFISGGPLSDGFASFTPGGSTSELDVLWVKEFDPRSSENGGSYTWEFWYRLDADDNDNSPHGDWFVSYAINDVVAPGSCSDYCRTSNEFMIRAKDQDCGAGWNAIVDVDGYCGETGTWTHMAFVVDAPANTAKTYINGALANTDPSYDAPPLRCIVDGPSAGCKTGGTLGFGAELDNVDLNRQSAGGLHKEQRLAGAMTEVRYWNNVRTEAQIQEYMNVRLRDLKENCTYPVDQEPCSEEQAAPCDPNAVCEAGSGGVACICREPYTQNNAEGFNGVGENGCVPPAPRSAPALTCASGLISGLGAYWPLSGHGDDLSGSGNHLVPGTGSGPAFVTAGASEPLAGKYAAFTPGAAPADFDLLWVKDFNPKSELNGGSYTWEFWYRLDADDNDNSPHGDWFVSYAVNDIPFPTGNCASTKCATANEFFMSTGSGGSNKCAAGWNGVVGGGAELCDESGVWHHMAFSVDLPQQSAKLYVDGVLQRHDSNYDAEPLRCAEYNGTECILGGTLAFGAELDFLNDATFQQGQRLAGAMTEIRYWNTARTQDEILELMNFRLEELDCGVYEKGETCNETESKACHGLAYCERIDGAGQCFCEMGMIGDGWGSNGCRTKGWALRVVYERVFPWNLVWVTEPAAREAMKTRLKECFGSDDVQFQRGVSPFSDAAHFPYAQHALLVNALFDQDNEPSQAVMDGIDVAACFEDGVVSSEGLRKYTWNYDTTSNEFGILPTGLQVDSVTFDTTCADSGCWVIDVTYTTGGGGAFNSFYLPHAVGSDTASYDFVYDDNTLNSYQPKNFPCRTHDYIKADGSVPNSLPDQVTTCCLTSEYEGATDNADDTEGGFVADYRPTQAFVEWVSIQDPFLCDPFLNFPDVIDRPDYVESFDGDNPFAFVAFPAAAVVPHPFLDGQFKDMPVSPGVVSTTTLDPFFYQYKAQIRLDEVELRRKAGQLRGTVGVEHTVDTFLGFVNFRPTGTPVLDAFATQVNIHLEKTSFFSVSTHGENAYTFLEYVNMRLISIYNQDVDFSGLNETADRTVRTDSSGNANYVQVTFTMGAQYAPNPLSGGLIPLDSVRAGRGTFMSDTTLEHLCSMYDEGNATAGDDIGLAGFADDISIFDDMLDQPCGPQSNMCVSPTTVPDQFVSFNIPLGFQVLDGQASSSLENNIFVSMVINALDKLSAGPNPNGGDDPMQMKTTLEASIPIVAGGVNIFCDGITAKTDLKDVANADIIVGSAASPAELTRLRIIKDVANTNLDSVPSANVDSDSIEAGLMTLVLKGNGSYFENGVVNSQGYSLELDDLITIHLMTDGEAPALSDAQCTAAPDPKPVDCRVRALLAQAPDDNSDANGLDTDGYKLNGAFKFGVKRGQSIAVLEPTSDLLAICPFNPTRPSGGLPLESCITRRDVQSRTYPTRTGAVGPTAMEILAQEDTLVSDDVSQEWDALALQVSGAEDDCGCADEDDCCEAGFMQMILGDNDYARGLAVDYVKAIDDSYNLNGRYNRAYWINPGYEWTPTQTAGKSLFSVSQKVYLFALITMDENIGARRRRMLLATDVNPTQDSGSGVGGAQLSFPVARTSIMAQAFDVPADHAVVFNVEMQLTQDEACKSDSEFVEHARETFMDFLDGASSNFHTVQVLGFSRSLNGVVCPNRRALRKLLADFSAATAEVQMMIVYQDKAIFNDKAFAEMPGITSVAVDAGSASNVKVDPTYVNGAGANPKSGSDSKSNSSGSSSTAMIAGIAGGIGGAVLVLIGVLLLMRSRHSEPPTAMPVQTISLSDLKAQLSEEV